MKILISIHDSKAETWSLPVCLDNKAVALRQFSDLVSDGRTLVGLHFSDFDLWKVGEFDDLTGVVSSSVPEHLANGSDVKSKE